MVVYYAGASPGNTRVVLSGFFKDKLPLLITYYEACRGLSTNNQVKVMKEHTARRRKGA